jgi:hypothetical protein
MIRNAVSVVLALGVMLTHLAAVPHLHGADVRGASVGGPRPHVHLGQFGLAGQPVPKPAAPEPTPGLPADHDADAWYLPDTGLVTDANDFAADAQAEDGLATAALAFGTSDRSARASAPTTSFAHACPLFVRHLALLI